jgi:hypothetical protein
MNSDNLGNSVVLITSKESNNSHFGTGFVIRKVSGTAYILTCSHVVRDVGGKEKVIIEKLDAEVFVSGEGYGIDLAVLRVDGLVNKLEINENRSDERENRFITAGFQRYGGGYLIRSLEGTLSVAGYQSSINSSNIRGWDLRIQSDYSLQPGFSGSPVIEEVSGRVLGIVSHREGERRGFAISIRELDKIWACINREELYRSLINLSYKKQTRLFYELVKNHSIVALLIHGERGYGQRWLLNLLIVKHLPHITTSRVIKVDFTRTTQRFDALGLWRQLCNHIQLPTNSPIEEIIKRVYKCCETQNTILIFHNVDWIPRESLEQIIQDFWLPLTREVKNFLLTSKNSKKLLMFLIDYKDTVTSLEDFFAGEKTDSIDRAIRMPEIDKFSKEDVTDWVSNSEIPEQIREEIDNNIQNILHLSDGGVPELTLELICDKFTYNWYEESEKWLTY